MLYTGFLTTDAADALYDALAREVPWQRDSVTVFGKSHPIPRLHQWFADHGATTTWSNLTMHPAPWPAALASVRGSLARVVGEPFDGCLANWYRDGNDTMGWHADDEPEFGPDPLIASVSVGAERDFVLRDRSTKERFVVPLPHGSLLLMHRGCQARFEHSLPRRKRISRGRINLTFRQMRANRNP